MSKLLQEFKNEKKRQDIPEFKSGDIVRVYQTITEGDEEKTHPFAGIVISRKGGNSLDATFTVRTKIKGVGVERTFPLHSPTIDKIEVQKEASRTSRSKHYWVRDTSDKKVRKKLKWRRLEKEAETAEVHVGKEEEEEVEKVRAEEMQKEDKGAEPKAEDKKEDSSPEEKREEKEEMKNKQNDSDKRAEEEEKEGTEQAEDSKKEEE